MTIDVLLPFHRNDNMLRESITSVLDSKYKDLRIILIDDRPVIEQKDKSFGIKSPKIILTTTSGQTGYGNALRVGSQMIESDIVALMNSDDVMLSDRFVSQLSKLDQTEICISRIQKISEFGRPIPSLAGDLRNSNFDSLFLILGSYGANATWCMRRDWWDTNSFFDPDECLDWRIALRSFPKSQISFIGRPLYYYRKHKRQTTFKRTISRQDISPVFTDWNRFLQNQGLIQGSFEIFSMISTPWNSSRLPKIEDLDTWLKNLNFVVESLSSELRKSFSHILARRFLFAVRRSSKGEEFSYYLRQGMRAIPAVTWDLARLLQ